jgi:hypothetical protein
MFFFAAALLIDPGYSLPLPPDMPEESKQAVVGQVVDLRDQLAKNSTAQQRTMLQQIMAEFWSKNAAPAIGQWHRQVELTANHAGLMVTNDIEATGRILRDEVAGSSKLGRGDKLKDLVMYGLSDRWLKLREHMKIQIDYSELFG